MFEGIAGSFTSAKPGGITIHINWKRFLTDYNWKGFLTLIFLLIIAFYFRSQMEWGSIEQVIIDTVALSIIGIAFLITILKPDFFIRKTMEPGVKWMIRIFGAVWVATFIWQIYVAWETYYVIQQINN